MKILIIISALITLTTALHAQFYGDNTDPRRTITVSGEAVVRVEPDEVVIHFGIESHDKVIKTAQDENKEILNSAISIAAVKGIEKGKIKTEYLNIEPRWGDYYERKDFLGYIARNSFTVTLSDTSKFEDLTSAMLEAGVTQIHNVQFRTTEFKKYREQARSLALTAAKEKAIKMASELGSVVGDPIRINETNYGNWYWYNTGWWGGSRNSGMSQNVVQNMSSGSGGNSDGIALGKISVKGSVSVTFEIVEPEVDDTFKAES